MIYPFEQNTVDVNNYAGQGYMKLCGIKSVNCKPKPCYMNILFEVLKNTNSSLACVSI